MRLLPLAILSLSLFVSVSTALADRIVLKNGGAFEGKILLETEESVTIEVKVSASITDEKIIPREEIASIEKAGEDDLAWETLKDIKLDPQNSLPAERYDEVMAKAQEFLMKFPDSKHAAAASALVGEFKAEADRLAAGEIKIFGKWLTKEDIEKNKDEIQGQLLLAQIRAAGARGDFAAAMNIWERMQNEAGGVPAFADAADYIKGVVATVRADLARRKAAFDSEMANRRKVLETTGEPQRTRIANAFATEEARIQAAIAAAKKAGHKWLPYLALSEESLTDWTSKINAEADKIAAIPTAALREAVASASAAEKAIADGDAETAATLVAEVKAKWPKFAKLKELEDAAQSIKKTVASQPVSAAEAAAEGDATTEATGGLTRSPSALQKEEDRPFYTTPKGALMIVAALAAVISIGNLISKALSKRAIK